MGYSGLFRHNDNEGHCVRYDDQVVFDESESAARWGGTLAPLLGGAAIFLCLLEFYLCRFPCSRLLTSTCFVAAQLFQGLTFLWLNSHQFCQGDLVNVILHQDPCSPDEGGIFAMTAMICFFACGVLVMCTPKPEPMRSRHDNTSVEKYNSQRTLDHNDASDLDSTCLWTVDGHPTQRNDKALWS
jgi:hypothetical protein